MLSLRLRFLSSAEKKTNKLTAGCSYLKNGSGNFLHTGTCANAIPPSKHKSLKELSELDVYARKSPACSFFLSMYTNKYKTSFLAT